MELYFLGTGAGVPAKARNVSSIALKMPEYGGKLWLFDSGEGTQQQILKSPLKLSKLEKLFVTHLHGDHIFGIPGLLGSRSFQGGSSPLTIYGPRGIRRFINTALKSSQTNLPYKLDIVEFTNGVIVDDKDFTVEIAQLDHVIPSYGFRITERDQAGKLQIDRLQAAGIPPGPLYQKIKQGERIQLSDGRTIDGRHYVGPPIRGRIVTILGDTRPCTAAVTLAQQADVLVHEATYSEHDKLLAARHLHSTTVQAAQTAHKANVTILILTHISVRYNNDDRLLLQEARQVFAKTALAHDFFSYTIPRK